MTNFTLSPTFDAANASQKAELLLRRLGVRRNLVGFDYTVYMSVQVAANPSSLQLITKRLYRETAKQFHTTSIAVERAVRTVIGDCWKLEDHSLLDNRVLQGSPSYVGGQRFEVPLYLCYSPPGRAMDTQAYYS